MQVHTQWASPTAANLQREFTISRGGGALIPHWTQLMLGSCGKCAPKKLIQPLPSTWTLQPLKRLTTSTSRTSNKVEASSPPTRSSSRIRDLGASSTSSRPTRPPSSRPSLPPLPSLEGLVSRPARKGRLGECAVSWTSWWDHFQAWFVRVLFNPSLVCMISLCKGNE